MLVMPPPLLGRRLRAVVIDRSVRRPPTHPSVGLLPPDRPVTDAHFHEEHTHTPSGTEEGGTERMDAQTPGEEMPWVPVYHLL